jgi:hypothetical protein
MSREGLPFVISFENDKLPMVPLARDGQPLLRPAAAAKRMNGRIVSIHSRHVHPAFQKQLSTALRLGNLRRRPGFTPVLRFLN